ncbi:hypothetical protein E4G67_00715 [Candidatus Bathyarchaeota archaeon]|nr:MAG: hypothetical protein E4G67_00715 [Candidatus Bathyarchaeota archaeon]
MAKTFIGQEAFDALREYFDARKKGSRNVAPSTFKISLLNQVILWAGAKVSPVMLTVYSIQLPF